MQQCAPETARGRWVYVPTPDEVPVTFQIGIVGSDGVLLASDRLVTRLVPCRMTSRMEKIIVREDIGLAYCCSGDDDFAATMGIVMDAHKANSSMPIDLRLSETLDEARVGRNTLGCGSILVACLTQNETQLWKFGLTTQIRPDPPCRMRDRWIIGDETNTAIFFSEKYLPISPQLPLERLLPLAAHTILMAHEMNPTGVDGLDITLCTREGFRVLKEDELSHLARQSGNLDTYIRAHLLS